MYIPVPSIIFKALNRNGKPVTGSACILAISLFLGDPSERLTNSVSNI